MYCSKCGTQLPEGTSFCGACGQPTGGVPQAAVTPSMAVGGGSAVPAYAAPGSVSPYAPSVVPAVLPSPYAGFWLRFLAYLIDSVLAGIVFGIFALLVVAIVGVGYFRTIFESLNSEDSTVPAAFIALILLASAFSVLITWVYYAWMEFPISGDARKNGAGTHRHRSAGAAGHVRACQRKIFCEDHHWNDSTRHRLHHGGIHGKEAGVARHDRRLPGSQENVDGLSDN
jgi:hypothetical protein